MGLSRAAAYDECRQRVAGAGSSFALGMRLFPIERRDDVMAVYAFFRETDDIVDADAPAEERRERFAAWSAAVTAALNGRPSGWLSAVSHTAARCDLPRRLFDDCLAACAGDLEPVRLATWESVERYCDGVAGTVGEACLRILGYRDAATLALSAHNARAVQLTNIVRDVAEDAARDRLYLPVPGVDGELGAGLLDSPALRQVAAQAAQRAEAEYRRAEPLFERLRPDDRVPMVALTQRYRRLLARLRAGRPSAPIDAAAVLARAYAARWWPTWRG